MGTESTNNFEKCSSELNSLSSDVIHREEFDTEQSRQDKETANVMQELHEHSSMLEKLIESAKEDREEIKKTIENNETKMASMSDMNDEEKEKLQSIQTRLEE